MATAAPGAARGGIDFGRAFTFVSEDPEWIKKVLIGGAFTLACALLVGIPFVLGYFARTLKNVAAGAERPLPPWDDLGGIFEQGLRLAVVYLGHALGVVVVAAALAMAILLPARASSHAGAAGDALGALSAFGLIALYGAIMLFSLLLAVYLPAAMTRTTLHGRVSDGFAWRENVAFIRANLSNYLLTLVAYLVASFVAQFGVLLCCVGVFPAAFWGYLVMAHGLGQTVRLSSTPA